MLAKLYSFLYGKVLLRRLRLQRLSARQDTYVFFDSLSSTVTEEIDAFTLFEYCREKDIPAVYIAAKDGYLYKKMKGSESGGIYFVKNEKENWLLRKELFALMLRARAVITSFGCIYSPLERFFRKSPNIEYICIGHGTAFFRESHLKGYYLSTRRYNRILVSNEYEKRLFLNHNWKNEMFIAAGLPRWDKLAASQTGIRDKKIFIFFTWRKTFGETKIALDEFEYIKKLKKFFASDKIGEIIDKYGVSFCAGMHHSLQDQCGSDLRALVASNVEFISNDQISRAIAESSMLITDFSSVFADFYFQNKPVIFYWLDENDDKLDDLEKDDFAAIAAQRQKIYNVVNDENEVFDRLEHYIKHNFKMDAEEQEKAEAFFYVKDNICKKIMGLMRQRHV